MSTQTRFDLDGLTRSIEQHDHDYRMALYADHADAEILDPTDSTKPVRLSGKAAIGRWLTARNATVQHHRVRDAELVHDQLTFADECRNTDGASSVYLSTATIWRGQIVDESIRREPIRECGLQARGRERALAR